MRGRLAQEKEDLWTPQGLGLHQRAALVTAHQPGVPRDVGRHDGGKAAALIPA